VGFYVSLAMLPKVKPIMESEWADSMWLQVAGWGRAAPLYLCSVYMPDANKPAQEVKDAFSALQRDVVAMRGRRVRGEVVMLGDFNARVGCAVAQGERVGQFGETTCNTNGALLKRFLDDADLYAANGRIQQAQPQYTYVHAGPEGTPPCHSIVDYVLLPRSLAFTQEDTPACELHAAEEWAISQTDHVLLWTVLPCSRPVARAHARPAHRKTPRSKLLLNKDNKHAVAFRSHLFNARDQFNLYVANLFQLAASGSLPKEEAASRAKTAFLQIIEQATAATIGYTTVRTEARTQRLWTPEVAAAVHAKRKAAAALRADSASQDAWSELIVRRRAVTAAMRAARDGQREAADAAIVGAWEKHAQGLASSAEFWQRLDRQYRSVNDRGASMLRAAQGGEVLVLPAEVAAEFARHHEQVGDAVSFAEGADFDAAHAASVKAQVDDYMAKSYNDEGLEALNQSVEINEVAGALRQLCTGTAASPIDGVRNEMLKYGGAGMLTMLHALFALQWQLDVHEQTPGLVKNLHKGGDRLCAGNYRPITLLSCIDKLYHRILANRLSTTLESEGLLHEGQNAFRPDRDCVQHALALHAAISARQAAGQDTYIFFADQAKAYDSVWRDGMLHKLWAKGIRGRMYRVIANMYQTTVLRVGHHDAISESFVVDQGVAQGDTLSPILFDVFVDDLLREVCAQHEGVTVPGVPGTEPCTLTALMYADDFMGAAVSHTQLQSVVNTVRAYFRRWRMKANVSKSAVMVVRGRGAACASGRVQSSAGNGSGGIRWGEDVVPQVRLYKYMGLMFHESGKWDAHVEFVKEKLEARARVLAPVFKNRNVSTLVKRAMLLAVLKPRAEFGAAVFATGTNKPKLDSMQMVVLKSAAGVPGYTSHAVLQLEWGVRPLSHHADMRLLELWHRVINMDDDRLVRRVALAQPKRSGSGMPDVWLTRVIKVMRALDIDADVARGLSVKEFKKLVNERRTVVYERELEVEQRKSSVLARYRSEFEDVHEMGVQFQMPQAWLQRDARTRGHQLVQQMRAGALPLRAHTGRFSSRRTVQDPAAVMCPCCNGGPETSEHFLFKCPAYITQRAQCFLLLADANGMAPGFVYFQSLASERNVFALFDYARVGDRLHTVVAPFVHDCWKHRAAVIEGRLPATDVSLMKANSQAVGDWLGQQFEAWMDPVQQKLFEDAEPRGAVEDQTADGAAMAGNMSSPYGAPASGVVQLSGPVPVVAAAGRSLAPVVGVDSIGARVRRRRQNNPLSERVANGSNAEAIM
jgi:hypothetical protein